MNETSLWYAWCVCLTLSLSNWMPTLFLSDFNSNFKQIECTRRASSHIHTHTHSSNRQIDLNNKQIAPKLPTINYKTQVTLFSDCLSSTIQANGIWETKEMFDEFRDYKFKISRLFIKQTSLCEWTFLQCSRIRYSLPFFLVSVLFYFPFLSFALSLSRFRFFFLTFYIVI